MKKPTAVSLVAVIVVAFSTFGAGTVAAYTTAQTQSVDYFQASAFFQIEIPGIGAASSNASGPIVIQLGEWILNPLTDRYEILTEILSLETNYTDPLVGSIIIRVGSDFDLPASSGKIYGEEAETYFPAISFFDLFIEVEFPEIALGPLTNSDSFRIRSRIEQYPPYDELYVLDIGEGETVPLFDGGGLVRAELLNAVLVIVPEPSTAVLLGFGLVGLAGWRRRKAASRAETELVAS